MSLLKMTAFLCINHPLFYMCFTMQTIFLIFTGIDVYNYALEKRLEVFVNI